MSDSSCQSFIDVFRVRRIFSGKSPSRKATSPDGFVSAFPGTVPRPNRGRNGAVRGRAFAANRRPAGNRRKMAAKDKRRGRNTFFFLLLCLPLKNGKIFPSFSPSERLILIISYHFRFRCLCFAISLRRQLMLPTFFSRSTIR